MKFAFILVLFFSARSAGAEQNPQQTITAAATLPSHVDTRAKRQDDESAFIGYEAYSGNCWFSTSIFVICRTFPGSVVHFFFATHRPFVTNSRMRKY